MADIQNELSNLLGKKSLEPLQQTVFEKGPQVGFTPPEVQNVYQEGKTYFPSPQVAVQQSNIDWYTLGQNAFNIALDTFDKVESYLIDTKINKIRDFKDQAESKLYDVETKISTEQYNSQAEKRDKNPNLIEELKKQAKDIKDEYKANLRIALSDDHDMIMNPQLDFNKLGMKYQELALQARGSDRDVDRTTNRMMYQLERTNRQQKQFNLAADSWVKAGTKRTEDNHSFVMMGQMPVPVDNGKPIFGTEQAEDGSWKIKTAAFGDHEEPVLVEQDGKYFFNFSAVGALDYEDIQTAIELEMKTPGSYLLSATAGQGTPEFEALAQSVATRDETEAVNPHAAAYVGIALARLPDHAASSFIARIPDLTEEQEMKLHEIRLHMKQGLPIENLSTITGLSKSSIGPAVSMISTLENSPDGVIRGNPRDSAYLARLNEAASTTAAIVRALGGTLENKDVQYAADARDAFGFQTAKPEMGMQLSRILQENPGIRVLAVRALATVEQNRGLWASQPDPIKAKQEVLEKILKEQVNASGWVQVGHTITGTPSWFYNPGLSEMQRTVSLQYGKGSPNLVSWNASDRTKIEDPLTSSTIHAKSQFMAPLGDINTRQNNPESWSNSLRMAKAFVPDLDEKLFTTAMLASVPTGTDPKTGTRIQDGFGTTADMLKIAVACSKSVLIHRFPKYDPSLPDETLLPLVKQTLDDMPDYSDARGGYIPWLEADLDTGAGSQDFLTQVRGGGIPIAITKLSGESGTDYLKLINNGSVSAGRFIPRADQQPVMLVHSVYRDSSGEVKHLTDFADNMKAFSIGASGKRADRMAKSGDIPGLTINQYNAENVILATDTPYTNKKFEQLFANRLVDEPLTDPETAIANLRQNGTGLEEVIKSDPVLKNVEGLLYEVASTRESNQKEASKRILFSDYNLTLLYKKAIENGAKTQADFVGFVLGAMRNAYYNNDTISQRDFIAQNMSKAGASADIVPDGNQKGRILWLPNTNKSYRVMVDNVKAGKIIMSGPAFEDKNKTAYFVVDPNNIPIDLKDANYQIIMDATKLPEFEKSSVGQKLSATAKAEKARNILYPKVNEPELKGIEHLNRQTTLPSEMQAKFRKNFNAFMIQQDYYDQLDSSFIDWAAYYADNETFPETIDNLNSKYILPGHSSTIPWTTRIGQNERYRQPPNALVSNMANDIKTVGGALGSFTDASQELGWFGKLAVPGQYMTGAAAYLIGGLSGFSRSVVNSVFDNGEQPNQSIQLDEASRKALQLALSSAPGTTQDIGEIERLREKQYKPNTTTVPDRMFDVVHFIMANQGTEKPLAVVTQMMQTVGLSEEAIAKAKASGLDPAEVEYQIRMNLTGPVNGQENYNQTEDMNQAMKSLSPDSFKLDPSMSYAFALLLNEALHKAGKQSTLDDAKKIASNPAALTQIKKDFMHLCLYPEGTVTRTRKTMKDSIVESLIEMLKQ